MSDPFIAEIRIFAGNFAIRNWAFCNGQLLPIAQNTALFSIIGTVYGGDGRTTLGLPNLQGRAPMHPGRGPGLTARRLGEAGGAETASLNVSQIGAHKHTFMATVLDSNSTDPAGRAEATTTVNYWAEEPAEAAQEMAAQTMDETGGGQLHPNLQPYLTLNYLIAVVGTFPARA